MSNTNTVTITGKPYNWMIRVGDMYTEWRPVSEASVREEYSNRFPLSILTVRHDKGQINLID